MIVVAGWLDFTTAAGRDEAVAAGCEVQQSTRDTEPGCLAYSFAADSGVPTRVQVFELWADTESLAAHFTHPNFLAMREVLRRFERAGSSVAKYRCDLSEPIYDEQRQPRADFFTAAP
ncbi:MAG: antibiotic biosynthesis monooxygenase [Actinomycetota bacterium]|nr:antibiotic biosynthesis monooxygenase [Actinomycetota bacterium]